MRRTAVIAALFVLSGLAGLSGTALAASASPPVVLDYPNGGKPIKISFHNGKAIDVKNGTGS